MAALDPTPLDSSDFAVLGRVALLSGLGPFPDGIDHALDVLRVGAEADACELFLLDRVGEELLLVGCTGPDAHAFSSRERFDVGQGFPGIVARRKSTLSSRNLEADARFLRPEVAALGYTSIACVPLVWAGRMLGTLHLAWKRDEPALDRGLRLLNAAGPTLAATLIASFADLMLPADAAPSLSNGGLGRLAERFRLAGRADAVTVIVLGADGDAPAVVSTGPGPLTCGHVYESLEGCPNPLAIGRCVVLRGDRAGWAGPCRDLPKGFARVIEVPLMSDERAVGIAFLGYKEDTVEPSTRRLGSLRTVADQVALHILPAQTKAPSPPTQSPQKCRLALQCFGPFTASVDGRQLTRKDFGRAKAIELLQVLILMRGRPISRDALAERLWPRACLKSGARSMHVAMHALRRALEPEVAGRQWVHIRSREDTFYLDLTSSCFVDIEEFRRLLALSHPAPGRPVDKAIEALDQINSLYRGRLFADLPDATWCEAERENLHDEYVDALVRLADLCSRHGGSERTISLLRQVSLMEPLREDVHRQLIRSLWSAGRRREARKRYELCVRILRDDLGLGPSRETRRLGELVWQR